MYLNKLSGEQKQLFLDLCIHASRTDSNFAEEEKECINAYCGEMQLDTIRYSTEKSLDDVIQKLIEVSTTKDLRIIAFEITALLLADEKLEKEEVFLVDKIINEFKFSETFKNTIIDEIKKLTELYNQMNTTVLEGR